MLHNYINTYLIYMEVMIYIYSYWKYTFKYIYLLIMNDHEESFHTKGTLASSSLCTLETLTLSQPGGLERHH